MKILRRSFLSILRGTSARRTWRTSSRRSRTNTGNQEIPSPFGKPRVVHNKTHPCLFADTARAGARFCSTTSTRATRRTGGSTQSRTPSSERRTQKQTVLWLPCKIPPSHKTYFIPPRSRRPPPRVPTQGVGVGGARERKKVSLPPLLYFSPINKSRSQKAPSSLEESPIIEKEKKQD